MKNLKPFLILALILFSSILMSNFSFSQEDFSEDSKYKTVALEIINSASTCALITLDKEGYPAARMMQTLPTKDDFVIWLATKPETNKVKQIEENTQVSLYYTEGSSTGYVCIKGHAEIINEPALKKQHWKEGWEAFYPDPEKDMVLIKISTKTMEVVSYTHGLISTEKDWSAKKIRFNY